MSLFFRFMSTFLAVTSWSWSCPWWLGPSLTTALAAAPIVCLARRAPSPAAGFLWACHPLLQATVKSLRIWGWTILSSPSWMTMMKMTVQSLSDLPLLIQRYEHDVSVCMSWCVGRHKVASKGKLPVNLYFLFTHTQRGPSCLSAFLRWMMASKFSWIERLCSVKWRIWHLCNIQ